MFGSFSSFTTPSLVPVSVPSSFISLFIFYILSYLLWKRMGCLSGCLVSSTSIQKLFCEICSAFKRSFDEFFSEKVISLSYSSVILGPPLILDFECGVLSQCFHSPLTFIKRLFSSSLLSAIRVVVLSTYLRLLIFLPTILIPACNSSSPTFYMMYSAYCHPAYLTPMQSTS